MDDQKFEFKPIGQVKSWYITKNATPRQSSICPESKASIVLNKQFFDKPYHALENLDQFSHIWILFYFHQNTNKKVRSKVKPPRLNGQKTGIFSTRSPHRPCAIGLSLVKLDKIDQNTIYVTGIDILNDTPVLDIKPYIYEYDHPKYIGQMKLPIEDLTLEDNNLNKDNIEFKEPNWIGDKGVSYKNENTINQHSDNLNNFILDKKLDHQFKVVFTERSTKQLEQFHNKDSINHNEDHLINDLKEIKNLYLNHSNELKDNLKNDVDNLENDLIKSLKCKFCFQYLNNVEEARQALINILEQDPRSVYRRTKCSDRLYYFTLDNLHVTCWFDEDDRIVELLKIKPNYL